jgi:quercetin dioxygenase-like cupin family protein
MSYSKINLRDLEDSVGGRVDGLAGRFGRSSLESRDLGISLWTYAPGVRGGAHSHREQEEAYVVVAGSGRMRVGEHVMDVGPWDVVRVSPDEVRGFEGGPDGLEIVAVGGPKPDGGDGVRSDAPWPGE